MPLMGWSGRAPAPPAMEAGQGSQMLLILLYFFDDWQCYPQLYPGPSSTISRSGLAQSVAMASATAALLFIVIVLLVLAIIVYATTSRPSRYIIKAVRNLASSAATGPVPAWSARS